MHFSGGFLKETKSSTEIENKIWLWLQFWLLWTFYNFDWKNVLLLFNILSFFCWFALFFRYVATDSSEFCILTSFAFYFWISILWQETNQQSSRLLLVESILLVMVLVLLVHTQIVHALRYELRSIHDWPVIIT